MVEAPAGPRGPWDDRWNTPDADELLAGLKDPVKPLYLDLLAKLPDLVPGLSRELIWHGTSWKWTLQYLSPGKDGEPELLFYLVPDPNEPLISVPFMPDQLEHVPVRRLNRYVRDGLRSAKWAVDIRWAKWQLAQPSEVDHLADLIKRKAKILLGESPSQKRKAG